MFTLGAFQKYVSTYFTPTLKSMWIACLNRDTQSFEMHSFTLYL